MSDNKDRRRSEDDAGREREIRKRRKFTLAEPIGRLAGPGALKGESPVARPQQAEAEIESWLRSHLAHSGVALRAVLHRDVTGSELLLNNFDVADKASRRHLIELNSLENKTLRSFFS